MGTELTFARHVGSKPLGWRIVKEAFGVGKSDNQVAWKIKKKTLIILQIQIEIMYLYQYIELLNSFSPGTIMYVHQSI
jgi:hypothetical protein